MPLLGSSSGSSEHSFRGNLDDFPSQFSLVDLTDIEPGDPGITTVIITGINYQAIVTATNNALVSIDGGAYATATLASPRYIKNNQTLSVKFDTTVGEVSDFSKVYSTSVKVGRTSANWNVITRAYDDTPDDFSFISETNLPLGVVINSNSVIISGLEPNFATLSYITSGIGSFSINNGEPVLEGSIGNGDTVYIQQLTPNEYSATNSTTLRIGTKSVTYSVTSRDVDTGIVGFALSNVINVPINSTQESNTITISGADNNIPLLVSISSPGQVKVNNGNYVIGATNCLNGDNLTVRIPSTALVNYGETVTTTLTVSGYSTTFSATVRPTPIRTFPNQFTFSDVSTVVPLTVITSDEVRLFGMTPGSSGTASISGNNGQFQVTRNGSIVRAFSTASAPVFNDDVITLRLTAPGENQNRQTSFTVSGTDTTTNISGVPGQTTDIWSVSSGSFRCLLPSTLLTNTFTDISNVEANTVQTRTFTVSGLDNGCDNIITTSSPNSTITRNNILVNNGATIVNGDVVRVSLTAAPTYSTERSTVITVRRPSGADSVSTTWRVTTTVEDRFPNALSISNQNVTGAPPSTVYTITAGTISGLTNSTTVTASITSTNGTARVSRNSTAAGSYATSVSGVRNGDVIRIQMTSDVSYGNTVETATLNIGDLSEQWTITTAEVPFPTIQLSASPNPAPFDGSSTLTWVSNFATNVTSSNFIATTLSGSTIITNITQNRDYNITVANSRGSASAQTTIFSSSPPAPTVGISLAANTIPNNQTTTLTWSSTNATSVVSANNFATNSVSGNLVVGPYSVSSLESRVFSITVQNTSGQTATASTSLTILPPTPTLIVSPSSISIPYNGTVSFSWSSSSASTMNSSGFEIGTQEFSGSRTFTNIIANTSYTITATNASGSVSRTINVTVGTPPPTINIVANPSSIGFNSSTTLSWTLNNATSYTSNFGQSGGSTGGSFTVVGLTTTTTYTVTATNQTGSASSSVIVNVALCQVTGILTESNELYIYAVSKEGNLNFNNGTSNTSGRYFLSTVDPAQRFTEPYLRTSFRYTADNLITRRAFTQGNLHRYVYNKFFSLTGYPIERNQLYQITKSFLSGNVSGYYLLEELDVLIASYANGFNQIAANAGGIRSFVDDCGNPWSTSPPTVNISQCTYNNVGYTTSVILQDTIKNCNFTPGYIIFGNKTDNSFDNFAAPYFYYRSTINRNLTMPNRPTFTYGQVHDTIVSAFIDTLNVLPDIDEIDTFTFVFNRNDFGYSTLAEMRSTIISLRQPTANIYTTYGGAYGQVDVCGNTFYKS